MIVFIIGQLQIYADKVTDDDLNHPGSSLREASGRLQLLQFDTVL